jgi:hypothetical protein
MRTSKSDPQAVFFSTLMYRLLLITYPKDFQREYASSMAQVFHDCCLRAFHTRGFLGMLSLWSVTLVDYIESAFVEYTRKGVHMNTSRFIRLGGLALILGTATFLTGLLVEVMILGHGSASNPNNYYSRSIDQFLAVLPYILMPSAMLLLTIGVMGLYLRYGPRASLLGKAGLVAGTAGGVLALATCIAGGSFGLTQFLLSDHIGGWWLWDLAMVAMCLLMGGIFTFGIDAVKRQLPSRWNFIPILVGVLFPLRILAGYLQETTTEGFSRWRVDLHMIDPLLLIITSVGLMALGYLLMSETHQEKILVIG